MNVLLVNGSPHQHGCTYTALREIADTLKAEGVDSEIYWLGTQPIRGCTGCGACFKKGDARCVFGDDVVNDLIAKAEGCDGYVFGSPVHYAAASGAITAAMDRMFYAASSRMRGKPAAAIVSARRAGTTAALDQLNKYFIISGMPIVSGQYWGMVHGSKPEDVAQDEEGMQNMRMIARNMAYMIKAFALARENGLLPPEQEQPKKRTNFIR